MVDTKFEEKEKFSRVVMMLAEKDRLTYLEAVEEYAEMIGLEIDIAAKLLTPSVIAKISEEAMARNLIDKVPMLPI